ncbi:DsbA family protein [Lacisediminihabitans changchengi]|uniref:Thioredoxin domain-containing protein n=1 Tax=Lacisediminihabitans changchengi TaxID=2787634 RepID=A0A934SPB1_9MICO|nr:thioredoxin domain-containing protein [Lacisediminihabitans changchengi]MBK4346505.1 thioredoxin domain-containing protein [Lacisediminihabitans changchengi]
MATPGSNTPGKKDRREDAREKARIEREAEKKRQRRNKIFLQGGIGAAVVAIVVIIVLVVVGNGASSGGGGGGSSKGPKNMGSSGILFSGSDGKLTAAVTPAAKISDAVTPKAGDSSDGVANIVTYVDWACPACQSFEKAYAADIADLVKSGKATLDVQPVSILDRNYQTSRYASRAANAAACVANFAPDKFLDAQNVFYDKQPQEGSNGLTNSQIKSLLSESGVGTDAINKCVDNETYKKWVSNVTAKVTSNPDLIDATQGGFSTPTVFVDGKRWDSKGDFLTFVKQNS